MAPSSSVTFGISLPHRSLDTIEVSAVRAVAQRAEMLGFSDLWVTNNTLDHRATCLDSLTLLSYAAAVTDNIGLGTSMLVLPNYHPIHVAHQAATLDYLSNGRVLLGVAIGREHELGVFQIPRQRRVRRFLEQVELIKALWTQDYIDYQGEIFHLESRGLKPRPVQQPCPPLWFGGHHPAALKRASLLADGWMAAGGSSAESFKQAAVAMRNELKRCGRDSVSFQISKRVFVSVHEAPAVARAELHRWFLHVYDAPDLTDAAGVFGSPEQVTMQLRGLIDAGANHLLLNPVARYREQVDSLSEIVSVISA